MSIKRTLSTAVVTLSLAAASLAQLSAPAAAGGLSPSEKAWIAGGLGFIAGAAVANTMHHNRHPGYVVVHQSPWELHVQRCYARYRSYDHVSDTYVAWNGQIRRCRL